jgi:hypothetical protein
LSCWRRAALLPEHEIACMTGLHGDGGWHWQWGAELAVRGQRGAGRRELVAVADERMLSAGEPTPPPRPAEQG